MKREKYPEDIVDAVLEFLCNTFIKEVLGEREGGDDTSEDQSRRSNANHHQQVEGRIGTFEVNPMLVILDNVQLMDEASWKLLELIKDECQRIAVVLLVQTDSSNNQIRIHPEAQQFY